MHLSDRKNFLRYRFGCLILVTGYWFYQFTITDYGNFGIHFRFLTIWGLSCALIATCMMYLNSLRGIEERYQPFVSATAVLNAMVVFLYWKLYFIDPNLVNHSGSITWFQEYYLHLLGPVLLILDALFINNSFKQIWRGLAVILGIFVLYILWSELVTGPLNRTPEGRVTQGLPYPFLNDMTIKERIIFYATTMVTGLVFYFSGVFIYLIKTYFLGGDSNRRQRF